MSNQEQETAKAFTPSTDAIRESHAFTVQAKIAGGTFGQGLAEFDRWLDAHDREVAAKALEDAADELIMKFGVTNRASVVVQERAVALRVQGETK